MPDKAMFAGNVPASYEQYLGPALFEPYAVDIAGRINKQNYSQVLELACGTGRVTKHLATQLPAGGLLTATDLNADMIAIAKSIVRHPAVEWRVADAQDLSFANTNHFDHVVCQFGLMFFPDKTAALREAHRVLQPGGRLLFNVWDSLEMNPASAIIRTVMQEVMGDNTPDFLAKGPYSFHDRDIIIQLLNDAGFEQISFDVVQQTAHYPTSQSLVKGYVDGSPLNAYLTQLPGELQQRISKRLLETVEAQYGTSGITAPMQAIVFTATKH